MSRTKDQINADIDRLVEQFKEAARTPNSKEEMDRIFEEVHRLQVERDGEQDGGSRKKPAAKKPAAKKPTAKKPAAKKPAAKKK